MSDGTTEMYIYTCILIAYNVAIEFKSIAHLKFALDYDSYLGNGKQYTITEPTSSSVKYVSIFITWKNDDEVEMHSESEIQTCFDTASVFSMA